MGEWEQRFIDVLAEAMQDAWDEFCMDTGCVPDAFRIFGPSTTRVVADFSKGNFVDWVLDRIHGQGYALTVTEPDEASDSGRDADDG